MLEPNILPFFHQPTGSYSYLIYDQDGGHGVIIDPVLDYDSSTQHTFTAFIDQIIDTTRHHRITLSWILETHAHADHLSAAAYVQKQLGGVIAIGERIKYIQEYFAPLFQLPHDSYDHAFGRYLHDNDVLETGDLRIEVLEVPGHTPACLAYRINDIHVFVGDTLFMPDVGTARADFPEGNAHTLYHSLQRLLSLPKDTILYMCHDYPPSYRGPAFTCTVLDQCERNIHIHHGITESIFVHMRTQRDRTLAPPRLLVPSLQVNICGGQVPDSFVFPPNFLIEKEKTY